MKNRLVKIVFGTLLIVIMAACGKYKYNSGSMTSLPVAKPVAESSDENEAPQQKTIGSDEGVDVDLTVLSKTVVYAQVYNMMLTPEEYTGKIVKMAGSYTEFYDESTGKRYHACIIQDATACCAQGIEFLLTDDYSYPDDYPKDGDEICVTGTFETYHENGYTYSILSNAALIDDQETES